MAFPSSPTNGQNATVNNVAYTYNSTKAAWVKSGALSTASPVSSVAGRTGAVALTAADIGAGTMPGSLTVSGALAVTSTLTASAAATFSSTVQTTAIGVNTAPPATGDIRATGYITAGYSDERLKNELGVIENALDKVDQLTGIVYVQSELAKQFGYNDYKQQVGLRAGDVAKVQPEATTIAPFDADAEGNSLSGENYLTVYYERLVPLLVEAIKELRQEVKSIKTQLK
jgi:hypothetical protein